MPGGNPIGPPGGLKPGGGIPGIPGMPGGGNGIPLPIPGGIAPMGGIIPIPLPAGPPRPGPGNKPAVFLSSSTIGGGPSTDKLTIISPRKITSPSDLFSS